MRLLVSVRSAEEAALALEGGADIIDAKEPAAGPLGPVAPEVLAAVDRVVPGGVPLSAALGDITSPGAAVTMIEHLVLRSRAAPLYLKIGFAGLRSADGIRAVLGAAVERAGTLPGGPLIVAAAYADHDRAGSASHAVITDAAIRECVAGVLIDTCIKDGSTLLRWVEPERLRGWASEVRKAGLFSALAGGLDAAAIESLGAVGVDVIGVRGAACAGGRGGPLVAAKVGRLRAGLAKRENGGGSDRL